MIGRLSSQKAPSSWNNFMKHPFYRKLVLALAAGALALGVIAGLAIWNAHRALSRASIEVEREHSLAFTTSRLSRPIPGGVESVSTAAFRDAAFFHDRLYICGPTGLWEYAPDGKLLVRYRVGLELPSAPLVSVAVGMATDATEPELYIATAGAGLLAFGDKAIRQLLPEKEAYRQLTAVLSLSTGRLLLGTEKNGVLVYDGKRLTPFNPLLSSAQVTALAGEGASFWVGTIDQGVLHAHAGQVDHFGESEGLPDPRVISIAVEGDHAFVGTPLGVAEFRDGRFARKLAAGFFVNSLLVRGRSLLVGTMDEGTLQVALDPRSAKTLRGPGAELPGTVQRLVAEGQQVYALTGGCFFALWAVAGGWRELVAGEVSPLGDRDVSALGFDGAGRLWVGYFDRGLDILDTNLQRARHVEDDHVFCVNRMVYDHSLGRMLVATANGLVLFDGEGRERRVLGRADGLIADHVSDLVLTPEGMALATPAGLTILSPSGARSVYAFEGLVNNHVYALAAAGSRLLAGTLGGLSILDGGHVLANFTTANSGLRHNWITAIVPVGDEWFVGTYGAGILRLDGSGNWQTFTDASGAFNVNNNALVAAGNRVYAGTMGRGLYVYDRASGRWTVVTAGLPSLNVTALALRDGYLCVGTDNGLIRIAETESGLP
jgi:ligand-binding sensor domain-containing protein